LKIGELLPPADRDTAFDLYCLNRIVDGAGCYCLTNAGGDILYIGQTISIRRRLIQHFDSEKRSALTMHGRVSQVWWRSEVAGGLDALERGWLEAIRLRDGELPPLNRIGGRM
jgi:hypothetical protein